MSGAVRPNRCSADWRSGWTSWATNASWRICCGKFVPHDTVDVTYLVVLEGGKNLAKAKMHQTDSKTVVEITRELRALAEKLRSGKDENFKKSMGPIRWLEIGRRVGKEGRWCVQIVVLTPVGGRLHRES